MKMNNTYNSIYNKQYSKDDLIKLLSDAYKEISDSKRIVVENISLSRRNKELLIRANNTSNQLNEANKKNRELLSKPIQTHNKPTLSDNEQDILEEIKELKARNIKLRRDKSKLEELINNKFDYGLENASIINISNKFYEANVYMMDELYNEYISMVTNVKKFIDQTNEVMQDCVYYMTENNIECFDGIVKEVKKNKDIYGNSAYKQIDKLFDRHKQSWNRGGRNSQSMFKDVTSKISNITNRLDDVTYNLKFYWSRDFERHEHLNKAYIKASLDKKDVDLSIRKKLELIKDNIQVRYYYYQISGKTITISESPQPLFAKIELWCHPNILTTAKWSKKKTLGVGMLSFNNTYDCKLFFDKMQTHNKMFVL